MQFYVLDASGEPVESDLHGWAQWMESGGRTIAFDTIGKTDISTVFLGLDHGWGRGEPILWETMVFVGGKSVGMDRYTSKAAALAGHRRRVEALSKAP